MTKNEDMYINFSGLTHDHSVWSAGGTNAANGDDHDGSSSPTSATCSTIAILRRNPMYDCLVLVKKYRECLDGYALEFPTSKINDDEAEWQDSREIKISDNESAPVFVVGGGSGSGQEANRQQQQQVQVGDENSHARVGAGTGTGTGGALARNCSRRKLVSRFLDGDDPMYATMGCGGGGGSGGGATGAAACGNSLENSSSHCVIHPISTQLDDDLAQQSGELVHVPVNGLLDRLKSYTESGLAVDSRVYAFAMGLKTAERILTTGCMREIHETPI